VLFSVAISSTAPHFGGESLELPAWIMKFWCRADPTRISQSSCDSASVAGVQVPALRAIGCLSLV
jgi:hypothetical protein